MAGQQAECIDVLKYIITIYFSIITFRAGR